MHKHKHQTTKYLQLCRLTLGIFRELPKLLNSLICADSEAFPVLRESDLSWRWNYKERDSHVRDLNCFYFMGLLEADGANPFLNLGRLHFGTRILQVGTFNYPQSQW